MKYFKDLFSERMNFFSNNWKVLLDVSTAMIFPRISSHRCNADFTT